MNFSSHLFREVDFDTISSIFSEPFGQVWQAQLLDGGMFNTTYLVEYGPRHQKAVLRLGPVNRHLLMGYGV